MPISFFMSPSNTQKAHQLHRVDRTHYKIHNFLLPGRPDYLEQTTAGNNFYLASLSEVERSTPQWESPIAATTA